MSTETSPKPIDATATQDTLLRCLAEEFESNGGHFASPDTDLIFRQAFADDWRNGNETTREIIDRLLKHHNTHH